MSTNHHDRNLLIGIIAIQLEFIDQDQLVAAMHRWVINKSCSLDEILHEQGAISSTTREALIALVDQRLKINREDITLGLATLTTPVAVQRSLQEIGDDEIDASLAGHRSSTRGNSDPETLAIGDHVSDNDRFRVLRPHAKGGLGEVFVAYDQQLNREVALKEIRLEHVASIDNRTRFIQEAEITGGLEHPGIVPVYGLGQYTDGRPYYAMRFIQGKSLRRAVEEFHGTSRDKKQTEPTAKDDGSSRVSQSLAFRELLGQFVQVCHAIDYAHSRGVVHRDIKPSNIMLGRFKESLIVDWGLAKSIGTPDTTGQNSETTLRPRSGSGSAPTQLGAAVGTPSYMSPEQAAGRHDEVDAASDIYSLGATLYFILTGVPPIEEEEDVGSMLYKVKRAAFKAPRVVSDSVPKPLEAVCLKAMSKDPADRYRSSRALADDLEHFLADEPTVAYAEPMVQRARRFSKRHQTAMAAGAVAVLIGFAALVFVTAYVGISNQTLTAANRTITEQHGELETSHASLNQARINAEDERAAAQRRQREAEQMRDELSVVVDYLEGMFLTADPVGAQNLSFTSTPKPRDELTARDILEMGEATIDDLQSTPRVQARLMTSIANSYRSLAFLDDAQRLLDEAYAIRQSEFTGDHPDLAESMHCLGWLKHDRGEYDEAERFYRDALEMRRNTLGDDHLETAETMFQLGWLLADISETEEAEVLFREVIRIRTESLGEDHRSVGVGWAGLIACKLAGDFTTMTADELQEMVSALENAVRIFQMHEGDENSGSAILAFQDAEIQHRIFRNFDSAEESYRESIDITSRLMGPRHPWVALAKHELATLLIEKQEYVAASELLREVLDICGEHLPSFHPKAGIAAYTLGDSLEQQGELEEAEKAFVQSAEIFAELFRRLPDRPNVWRRTAFAFHELARLRLRLSQFDLAMESANDAMEVVDADGSDNTEKVYILRIIAQIHNAADRPSQAESTLREAFEMAQRLCQEDESDLEDDRELSMCAYLMGKQLVDMDRPEEALEFLELDRTISRDILQRRPFEASNEAGLIETEVMLAHAFQRCNRLIDAHAVMLEQLNRVRSTYVGRNINPTTSDRMSRSLLALALLERLLDNHDEGRQLLEEAEEILVVLLEETDSEPHRRRLEQVRELLAEPDNRG